MYYAAFREVTYYRAEVHTDDRLDYIDPTVVVDRTLQPFCLVLLTELSQVVWPLRHTMYHLAFNDSAINVDLYCDYATEQIPLKIKHLNEVTQLQMDEEQVSNM